MHTKKKLHIIMPMAGLGTRFQNTYFHLPKPLIPVGGIPMYQVALSSFNSLKYPIKLTCIFRKELEEKFLFATHVRSFNSEANLVVLDDPTRGAVETCLYAESQINKDEGLVVLDCDLWFQSHEYLGLISNVLEGKRDLDGGIVYFNSTKPRYSYAEINNGLVVRTAEKKVISSHALAGAYFFSRGDIFINASKHLLRRSITTSMSEYYLSYLYNHLIEEGSQIGAAKIDNYKSFGTPEELENYTK
jgi:UDP-N-acetylglucosamine diphosphorylase / glucose-1-phosphate thymidylyltransferase / UDP-N-acetylgalactosamine diphosphorylase / glucosamine-1-phosphate N-acetyltransferase / galactosamine-1-phosphate N-acetyltransferase